MIYVYHVTFMSTLSVQQFTLEDRIEKYEDRYTVF